MTNLSVQQAQQLDTYLKTHSNVSREQAIKILFPKNGKSTYGKGVQVEKSCRGGGQTEAEIS